MTKSRSNAVANAAKGDLTVGSGTNLSGVLGVGSNGDTIVADSSTATGLKWAAPATGMTNPMTTTGDTIYSNPNSTPVRLPIGSTGQVLTVAGGVPSWASAASTNANWVLAGTSALSGSSTVTISGLSNANQILLVVSGAGSATASLSLSFRINADTANNYSAYYGLLEVGAAYSTANLLSSIGTGSTNSIPCARMSTNVASTMNGYCLISGGATTGKKVFQFGGAGNAAAGNSQGGRYGGGFYDSTSVVSSVSAVISSSTFDKGTLSVYTTA